MPKHWSIARGKWLFRCMHRPVRLEDDVITAFRDGTVTLRKNRRLEGFTNSILEIGYQGIRKGDLVIHGMDAFAGAIGVSDSDGKSTPVYSVCVPKQDEHPTYFCRLLRYMSGSGYIQSLARGIRERSSEFRYEQFANLEYPVPPRHEQDAIVAFLEAKERDMAAFIANKRRMIELLQERQTALINHAVTRGLNPKAPRKPSGIQWLGDIPKHWEMRRAKQLCSRIIDCKNRTPDVIPDGEFIVVRTSNVRNGLLDLTSPTRTNRVNYIEWTQRGAPQRGDVFFTREAPAGEACLVPENTNLCMGQRMMYFRPASELLDPEFLLLSIYGPVTKQYVEVSCNGSTVGHLRLGQVYGLPLLWCPVDEQKEIVRAVKRQTEQIARAIATAEREIKLMEEYRTALIAAAVTGKIDVLSETKPTT